MCFCHLVGHPQLQSSSFLRVTDGRKVYDFIIVTASSYAVSFLDKNLANYALIVGLTGNLKIHAGFHVLHKICQNLRGIISH